MLEWLSTRLADGTPKSSFKLYFELLDAVMGAAVVDKVIAENPCDGVKLSQILRGLSHAPKWVPTEGEVLALLDVVPARYRAAIWLGAGQGCRLGETLGMEHGAWRGEAGLGERLVDTLNGVDDAVDALVRGKVEYRGQRVRGAFQITAGDPCDREVGVRSCLVTERPGWIQCVCVRLNRPRGVRLRRVLPTRARAAADAIDRALGDVG